MNERTFLLDLEEYGSTFLDLEHDGRGDLRSLWRNFVLGPATLSESNVDALTFNICRGCECVYFHSFSARRHDVDAGFEKVVHAENPTVVFFRRLDLEDTRQEKKFVLDSRHRMAAFLQNDAFPGRKAVHVPAA